MTIDNVQPGTVWKFDADVTEAFDNMLARSIPQYDVMRDATTDLAVRFAQPQTRIVDLGCSRGVQLRRIVERLGAHNRYLGIDVSEPMLAAARADLAEYIATNVVEIRDADLRTQHLTGQFSVALSVLTLQFIPIEYRQRIVREVYERLINGGAFLLVEKCLGADYELDHTFVDLYYELKARNGYTPDDIDRKRLSLEGVLVPITAQWNKSLLRNAGFTRIDCYWRWMNFAAWIAIKENART